MKFHNTSFFVILTLLFSFSLSANATVQASEKSEVKKSIKTLKNVSTSSDSIQILLNAYSKSDLKTRNRLRGQIISIASHTDDHDVINSVIKELANSTDETTDLGRLLEMSEGLPGRESLQTVLQMEQAKFDVSNLRDSQLEQDIAEYAKEGMSISGNPYKEIQNIYRALMYLGTSSQGPMYHEYIKRLEELVESLPENEHAIRNLYYTTAAIYYTRKRDYRKAIELDKKLLSQLDEMETYYRNIGDENIDLDYFYYVSYRRMLRNYKGLTLEEVDDIYNRVQQLAEKNEKVAEAMGNLGLTNSYYYMAHKDYVKAIPELHKALENQGISKYRKRELLGALAVAYRATGNEKEELKALRDYTVLLVDDREERLQDMYKEIELRNSVNKLVLEEYKAQEQQREENRVMRKTSLTLVYVLALALIFLCGAYFKLRTKVKELQLKNNRLRTNIEHIFDDGTPKGTRDLRRHNHGLKG